MKIPSYIEIYWKGKKLKPDIDCPKEVELSLQKAIDAVEERIQKLAERFAPYSNEEDTIDRISQYTEFKDEVKRRYKELRKIKSESVKSESMKSKSVKKEKSNKN